MIFYVCFLRKVFFTYFPSINNPQGRPSYLPIWRLYEVYNTNIDMCSESTKGRSVNALKIYLSVYIYIQYTLFNPTVWMVYIYYLLMHIWVYRSNILQYNICVTCSFVHKCLLAIFTSFYIDVFISLL